METLLYSPSRFPVGSRVRSYDFPGNVKSYVEGYVEDYQMHEGCLRYVIRAVIVLVNGKAQRDAIRRKAQWYMPPVNGTPKFTGSVCAVQLLSENFTYSWLDVDIAEQAAAYNMTPERFAVFMSGAAAEQEYYEQCPWMYGEAV